MFRLHREQKTLDEAMEMTAKLAGILQSEMSAFFAEKNEAPYSTEKEHMPDEHKRKGLKLAS